MGFREDQRLESTPVQDATNEGSELQFTENINPEDFQACFNVPKAYSDARASLISLGYFSHVDGALGFPLLG